MDIPSSDFNPFGSVETTFMRYALISRTNVNPARMFRTGLTPTIPPPYLRDRQSRTLTAWRMPFGLQNLSENWSFFIEKTSKNYHKIMTFHDVVNHRPMHSLRWRTWRFSPFLSQVEHTWSLQTSDSSVIDKKVTTNWPISWSLFDQEYDHKIGRNQLHRKSESRDRQFKKWLFWIF